MFRSSIHVKRLFHYKLYIANIKYTKITCCLAGDGYYVPTYASFVIETNILFQTWELFLNQITGNPWNKKLHILDLKILSLKLTGVCMSKIAKFSQCFETQIRWSFCIVTAAEAGLFAYYVIICDFKNIRPQTIMAASGNEHGGSCNFNDVVAFDHNQLRRPPVAKFRLWVKKMIT